MIGALLLFAICIPTGNTDLVATCVPSGNTDRARSVAKTFCKDLKDASRVHVEEKSEASLEILSQHVEKGLVELVRKCDKERKRFGLNFLLAAMGVHKLRWEIQEPGDYVVIKHELESAPLAPIIFPSGCGSIPPFPWKETLCEG